MEAFKAGVPGKARTNRPLQVHGACNATRSAAKKGRGGARYGSGKLIRARIGCGGKPIGAAERLITHQQCEHHCRITKFSFSCSPSLLTAASAAALNPLLQRLIRMVTSKPFRHPTAIAPPIPPPPYAHLQPPPPLEQEQRQRRSRSKQQPSP